MDITTAEALTSELGVIGEDFAMLLYGLLLGAIFSEGAPQAVVQDTYDAEKKQNRVSWTIDVRKDETRKDFLQIFYFDDRSAKRRSEAQLVFSTTHVKQGAASESLFAAVERITLKLDANQIELFPVEHQTRGGDAGKDRRSIEDVRATLSVVAVQQLRSCKTVEALIGAEKVALNAAQTVSLNAFFVQYPDYKLPPKSDWPPQTGPLPENARDPLASEEKHQSNGVLTTTALLTIASIALIAIGIAYAIQHRRRPRPPAG